MLPIELLIALLLVGLASGVASGLFGVGGGIVTVPCVLVLTQLAFRDAVAVSLLSIAATVPLGLWAHHRAGFVRWRMGWTLGLTGLAGVAVAQVLDPYLSDVALHWLFAAFLLLAAHRLAYGTHPLLRVSGPVVVAATGFAAGVIAKLLGIGGGILIVPWLVVSGFTMHAAVATSLVAVLLNGVTSTAVNLVVRPGSEWLQVAAPVLAGALAGTYLGARWGQRTHAESLQRAFAVILSLVALNMVVRSLE